jgi:long-chain acyl-CoA synthetase
VADSDGGLFVSGGAALAPVISDFYNALGVKVLQGYGLTETTGPSNVTPPDDYRPWTVGPPIGTLEMKIAGDGEILVRGPSVMDGYYNLPEDTTAALDADGWFHTGDIGEIEDGHFKITDRKKDILVLANGKNVAPQPIENKLRQCPLIADAVLFGDGNEYVYGLILPNFERIEKHIVELGMTPPTRLEQLRLDAVKRLFKEQIDGVNKTLADFERVKRYVILDATFSVDTGELTPSLKVRRKFVREKYADALKDAVRG